MCDTELHAYIRRLLECRYACMHAHAHGYRVCIESRGRFRKCPQLLFYIIHRGSFSVRQSSLTQVGSLASLLLGSFYPLSLHSKTGTTGRLPFLPNISLGFCEFSLFWFSCLCGNHFNCWAIFSNHLVIFSRNCQWQSFEYFLKQVLCHLKTLHNLFSVGVFEC